MKIKWIKLEPDESYYESKCKRFEINPLYNGRVRPQGWEVVDTKTNKRVTCWYGLKWAKDMAQEMLEKNP